MKIENLSLTKGETLLYLQNKLSACVIPKTMLVKVSEFFKDPVTQFEKIETLFPLSGVKLAIRSSAQDEDTMGQSQAGLYHSVLNVEIDREAIRNAIDAVIESYTQSLF